LKSFEKQNLLPKIREQMLPGAKRKIRTNRKLIQLQLASASSGSSESFYILPVL
jgi:hypothetical protein